MIKFGYLNWELKISTWDDEIDVFIAENLMHSLSDTIIDIFVDKMFQFKLPS